MVIDMRNDLPSSGELSPSDVKSVRLTSAQLRLTNRRFIYSSQLLLARIGALNAQVPLETQRQLAADARAIYGPCVVVPDLKAAPGAGLLSSDIRSPSISE